jgi:hypothetical protein
MNKVEVYLGTTSKQTFITITIVLIQATNRMLYPHTSASISAYFKQQKQNPSKQTKIRNLIKYVLPVTKVRNLTIVILVFLFTLW